MSRLTVEIISDLDEGGFTARLPAIPAYGEGATEDGAIADLKVALRGHIETCGLDDSLARLGSPKVRELDSDLTGLAHG